MSPNDNFQYSYPLNIWIMKKNILLYNWTIELKIQLQETEK